MEGGRLGGRGREREGAITRTGYHTQSEWARPSHCPCTLQDAATLPRPHLARMRDIRGMQQQAEDIRAMFSSQLRCAAEMTGELMKVQWVTHWPVGHCLAHALPQELSHDNIRVWC